MNLFSRRCRMRKYLVLCVALAAFAPGPVQGGETLPEPMAPEFVHLDSGLVVAACVENGTPVPCWRELIIAGATGIIAMAQLAACIGTALDPIPGDEAYACMATYGTTTLAGITLWDLIECLAPMEEDAPHLKQLVPVL
jgi:hypothetical protein